MNHITNFAESFMKLFQLGGETFISWMTNIVPLVLMLLIAMNAGESDGNQYGTFLTRIL